MANVIGAAIDARLRDTKVAVAARVVSFSEVNQTAEVQPVIQARDSTDRPPIPGVPVVFPGVYWDVQADEEGLLIACDEDWRRWWRLGTDSPPEDDADHDLSNSLFLPGVRSLPNARTLSKNSAVLERPSAGGTVRLGTTSATKAAVHEDLLPALDDLLTDWDSYLQLFNTWAAAVGVATGVAWTAQPVQVALAALIVEIANVQAGIGTGKYQSPSVKVED